MPKIEKNTGSECVLCLQFYKEKLHARKYQILQTNKKLNLQMS